MHITVVIPTWQEAATIATCLDQLLPQAPPFDVVVVDGGSTDATLAIANDYSNRLPLRCVVSPQRGRAAQMNWGAQQSDPAADVLLFLHADSLLPPLGLTAIRDGIGTRPGGRFRVQLDDSRWPYSLISWGINWRSQLTGAFTGDMGIFIRRDYFQAIGGFPEWPLMEDLAIANQLPDACFLPQTIITSSRRWQQQGPWRTVALMQILRLAFRLGVSPQQLHQWYRSVR